MAKTDLLQCTLVYRGRLGLEVGDSALRGDVVLEQGAEGKVGMFFEHCERQHATAVVISLGLRGSPRVSDSSRGRPSASLKASCFAASSHAVTPINRTSSRRSLAAAGVMPSADRASWASSPVAVN